jgi:hypothetical protein
MTKHTASKVFVALIEIRFLGIEPGTEYVEMNKVVGRRITAYEIYKP